MGTAHRGKDWVSTVGLLRTACSLATWIAEPIATPSRYELNCVIDRLDGRTMRILLVVLGILCRLSVRP